jgi:hypothetical protein
MKLICGMNIHTGFLSLYFTDLIYRCASLVTYGSLLTEVKFIGTNASHSSIIESNSYCTHIGHCTH